MITEIEVFDFWGPAWRVRYGPVLCPFPWAGRLPHGEMFDTTDEGESLVLREVEVGIEIDTRLGACGSGQERQRQEQCYFG
jgi:hypothetical protein